MPFIWVTVQWGKRRHLEHYWILIPRHPNCHHDSLIREWVIGRLDNKSLQKTSYKRFTRSLDLPDAHFPEVTVSLCWDWQECLWDKSYNSGKTRLVVLKL